MAVDVVGGSLAAATLAESGRSAPPVPVLVFGAAARHARTANVTEVDPSQAPRVQLDRRFGFGLVAAGTWQRVPAGEHRLLVHNLVTHLVPGAYVWIDVADAWRREATEHALACGLEPMDAAGELLFRRTGRVTVHDLVAAARARLVRTTPHELAVLLAGDHGCVVLDTRTSTDRERLGTVPGAIHVPRTTLEWRVDPSSGYSHPDIRSFEQCLVVMCTDGYSSSLAADSLRRLGFVRATDLVGGFTAWRDAGLPVERPGAGPATDASTGSDVRHP
ncbi:MAG: rhodanese-like domain-containing protein [Kineosporiaceae bacterium]